LRKTFCDHVFHDIEKNDGDPKNAAPKNQKNSTSSYDSHRQGIGEGNIMKILEE